MKRGKLKALHGQYVKVVEPDGTIHEGILHVSSSGTINVGTPHGALRVWNWASILDVRGNVVLTQYHTDYIRDKLSKLLRKPDSIIRNRKVAYWVKDLLKYW